MQKTILILTALFITFFLSGVRAETQDSLEKGRRLYKLSCADCHGRRGEKAALGQSAVINRLQTDEIVNALQERKAGKVEGAGNAAKKRLSEQDMQEVAEFIRTLK